MFGKIFESLYTGSMLGAGSVVFAVWGYVIANQKPDKEVGSQVEINPDLLAFQIGESKENIQKAIDFLCSPDKKRADQPEEGRRMIKLGGYSYRVVNGPRYMAIRNEEERRASNRTAQAVSRARKHWRDKKLPLNGELEYLAAIRRDATQEELDAIQAKHAPVKEAQ